MDSAGKTVVVYDPKKINTAMRAYCKSSERIAVMNEAEKLFGIKRATFSKLLKGGKKRQSNGKNNCGNSFFSWLPIGLFFCQEKCKQMKHTKLTINNSHVDSCDLD